MEFNLKKNVKANDDFLEKNHTAGYGHSYGYVGASLLSFFEMHSLSGLLQTNHKIRSGIFGCLLF